MFRIIYFIGSTFDLDYSYEDLLRCQEFLSKLYKLFGDKYIILTKKKLRCDHSHKETIVK